MIINKEEMELIFLVLKDKAEEAEHAICLGKPFYDEDTIQVKDKCYALMARISMNREI